MAWLAIANRERYELAYGDIARVHDYGTLLLVSGCSTLAWGPSYMRTGPTEPPLLKLDDRQIPPTKYHFRELYGPPTYTVETPDGLVCIWRDSILKPQSKGGHCDYIMTFDHDGNFLPTDLKADYGLCRRCGFDLREFEGRRCPDCGTISRDGERSPE